MEQDYITVIIPVYNAEKYLKRCIESILSQTYKKIEIILIDDGSLDNSGKICDEYAKKYKNIKSIHKNNEGAGLARNMGLNLAQSKYVAFVDADDFIDKNMYQVLYNSLIQNNAQACFCGVKTINKNNNTKISKKVKDIVISKKDILTKSIPYICSKELTEDFLVGAIALWHGLYNLEIIKNNKIKILSEREYISEDTIFNLNYFIKCERIAFVEQYLYNQYITDNSVSRAYKPQEVYKFKKFYKYVYDFILNNNIPDSELNIKLLNRRYINLYKHAIAKEIKLNSNKNEINKNIKTMCENDEYLQKIIKDNEFINLSLKESIFVFVIKYRIYFILKIIFNKK